MAVLQGQCTAATVERVKEPRPMKVYTGEIGISERKAGKSRQTHGRGR